MTVYILFGLLLLLILMGFPVILGIGLVGLIGIYTNDGLIPALFAQKTFTILDNFSLLAMPYFILAGAIIARGGLAKSLIEFSESVVGHIRGSLGHTTVLSSMAMANISGSSTAEAAAIGTIVIPEMTKRGYPPGLAASIVGTAATIGPVIPPSMTMIIYGSMTGVSIGGLFLAGILPGILLGFGLMTTILLLSFLPGYPELRVVKPFAGFWNIVRMARKVWVILLAPVIVLGGILGGVFTATEAGVVACLYAFLVSHFVFGTLKLSDMPSILLDSAVMTAIVVGIISMSGALGWLLSYLSFNESILGLIQGLAGNATTAILLLLAAILIMSMFIESLAVLIILVPVASFVGRAYGIDPLHLGIVMVIATQIGATTPPVAVLLFVTTSIAKCSFVETLRYCAPFILTLIAVLALIVFVPAIATTIPRIMMP
jgi:tripartite ATP-independent transporter DctM subunit